MMNPDSAKGLSPEFISTAALLHLNTKHAKFINSCLAECSRFAKTSLILKISYFEGYLRSLDGGF